MLLIGLGFYALHNTLQTNATQMTPQARGTAVAVFSSAIYLGQTAGVPPAALGLRPLRRRAAVPGRRDRAAGAGAVVRARAARTATQPKRRC